MTYSSDKTQIFAQNGNHRRELIAVAVNEEDADKIAKGLNVAELSINTFKDEIPEMKPITKKCVLPKLSPEDAFFLEGLMDAMKRPRGVYGPDDPNFLEDD